METITLSLFCIGLLICVVLNASILYALGAGLGLFLLYGLKKGFTPREMLQMCISGVKTARNVLITFLLIGILTALWRASGTIPVIICYSAPLMRPAIFLMMVFLLNCGVSVLTGTAFGTAATMGVICSTMAVAMDIPPVFVGGAVLSGVFFGDRCSPVSTSALLVSELTETNIFQNIRAMVKTAAVPFVLTCVVYLLLGFWIPHQSVSFDMTALFAQELTLHWVALLPALVILLLSFLRVNVKRTMLLSILTAIPICLLVQHRSPLELIDIAIWGYTAKQEALAAMLSGGGVVSMVKVASIVCLSSAYSGIFQRTGLLNAVQDRIVWLSGRITSYGAMLVTSVLAGAVACNQTLAILLTHQLCQPLEPDREKLAISLENTAVVVAPLIPWSIAGGVPLASANAPTSSLLLAVFLYALPAWRLLVSLLHRPKHS